MRIKAGLQAVALAALSLSLIAAQDPLAPQTDHPAPPPLVAQRIVDGRFEPGHFEYLRGYFPEASDSEKAQYAELLEWLKACDEQGRHRL